MEQNDFEVRILEPEGEFYHTRVAMLEIMTVEGRIGILPGHLPLAAVIGTGTAVISQTDGEKKKLLLQEGFAEVLQDRVMVFTRHAGWDSEK